MTWNDAPCEYGYKTYVCEKPLQEGSIDRLWIGLNDLVTNLKNDTQGDILKWAT